MVVILCKDVGRLLTHKQLELCIRLYAGGDTFRSIAIRFNVASAVIRRYILDSYSLTFGKTYHRQAASNEIKYCKKITFIIER